jgi:hypothetical protein
MWKRMEETMSASRILAENSLGKCPLVRLRRRWEDNIKMVHRMIRWEDG